MSGVSLRQFLILGYLVGNALTYRHLVRAAPEHALDTGTMLWNLAISSVWPLYWALQAIT